LGYSGLLKTKSTRN